MTKELGVYYYKLGPSQQTSDISVEPLPLGISNTSTEPFPV